VSFQTDHSPGVLPTPDALLEMLNSGEMASALCAALTPAIKDKLKPLNSGQVLEVRVDDPAAEGDISAWCRLSGHQLLAVVREGSILRCYLRKK
jgi:tRNA 2-thiouridine synthesizing protein A